MDIAASLREQGQKTPNRPAIIFRDQIITFSQMISMVNRLANNLNERGIKKGDNVAVYLPSCPEYIISYFAIFSLGAVIVPLDPNLTSGEVVGVLKHAEAPLIITKSLKDSSFLKLKEEVPNLKDIIVHVDSEEVEGFTSFKGVLAKSRDEIPAVKIEDNDVAVIFYTSGTTGKPKGVMLTYKNLENACKTMKEVGVQKYFGDMQICALPLSHIGGMIYLQMAAEYGISTLLMQRFIPIEFLKNVEKYKVNWFHLVPAMFMALLQLKEFEKYDLASVSGVDIFGAPSPPSLIQRFGKYCPNATLWHGWGMTETAAPNTATDKEHLPSVGKPPSWFEVKIFDNNDKEVPVGEIGEIVCRGWPIMAGYYKEPELTARVMRDGWFRTGDLGTLDKDGYLYIRGRKKDMIIVGGLNVYSPEVEHVIAEYPKIKEVAVIGVPDKLRGEIVKAVVVLKEGEEASESDIRSFCRQKLIHFKVPHVVEFRQSLPKTRTGKIQKESLK